MPSTEAIVKAVVLTAVSIVIINFARPYLPQPVADLLKA